MKEGARVHKECRRKIRYATRQEALDSLADLEAKGWRDLHAYPCLFCNGHHIGHRVPRSRRRRRKS